jgi:hypothetical protein
MVRRRKSFVHAVSDSVRPLPLAVILRGSSFPYVARGVVGRTRPFIVS